ncbi:MAG: MarR family winged helix-turn-helix transcriptional regulator [Woeseiaceae bacterium]|nr:MarR family winged helix-turn-helix transcriptional regulator [Woeseiaceae bacterium]
MHERSNTALVALRRILRVTELNSRRLASQSELTASQLLVLQHTAREGKALPSEIARTIDLKQATVTVLVNKLEEAGLVSRRRDTEDRRRVWIEPTDEGAALLEQSPDLLQDRFKRNFEALDEWEQAMIVAVLEKVATLLDAAQIDASPVLDVGDLDRIMAAESDSD